MLSIFKSIKGSSEQTSGHPAPAPICFLSSHEGAREVRDSHEGAVGLGRAEIRLALRPLAFPLPRPAPLGRHCRAFSQRSVLANRVLIRIAFRYTPAHRPAASLRCGPRPAPGPRRSPLAISSVLPGLLGSDQISREPGEMRRSCAAL